MQVLPARLPVTVPLGMGAPRGLGFACRLGTGHPATTPTAAVLRDSLRPHCTAAAIRDTQRAAASGLPARPLTAPHACLQPSSQMALGVINYTVVKLPLMAH